MAALCTSCGTPRLPMKHICVACGHFSALEAGAGIRTVTDADFTDMSKVPSTPVDRIRIGFLDELWGPPHDPGFVPTDAHLIAGGPGAGKTTLLLMLSLAFAVATSKPTYYVCSEQGLDDLRRTLDRLKLPLKEGQLKVLSKSGSGANVDVAVFKKAPPGAICLDSVTDFVGAKNRDAQLALCKVYRAYAKEFKAPTLIISQINKAEDLIGAMEMQHAVDSIIALEPLSNEPRRLRRILREYDCEVGGEDVRSIIAYKNRNGPAMIDFPLAMTGEGLIPLQRMPVRGARGGKGGNPLASARLERAALEDQLTAAQADVAAARKEIAALDDSSLRLAVREERAAAHEGRPVGEVPPEPRTRGKREVPTQIIEGGQVLVRRDRPRLVPTEPPDDSGGAA